MPTMYDRLGDLLNETLEAGAVKYIRIDKQGKVSEANQTEVEDSIQKEANENSNKESSNSTINNSTKSNTTNNDSSRTEKERRKESAQSTQQKKREYIIYKKITPEIERCYRLLDISVSANLNDMKKAYKEKLKYYHPDRHADNPVLLKVATDKTRQIVEAYKILVSFISN